MASFLLGLASIHSAGPYEVDTGSIPFLPGLLGGPPYTAKIAYPKQAVERRAGSTNTNSTNGNQLFPFVSFAHGTGGGSLLTYLSDLNEVASYGFIVVAPQSCPVLECSSGFYYDQLATIEDCAVNRHLHPALASADFSKTGVFGHSMGAMATVRSAEDANAAPFKVRAAVSQHTCLDPVMDASLITKVPVLYIAGQKDTICPPLYSQAFFNTTVAARKAYFEIAGASHFEPCDGQGALRELEPTALFLACNLRGEHCDEVYGVKGLCAKYAGILSSCRYG